MFCGTLVTRAFQASQVVITLDKDFGELSVVHQMPHYGIVRLVALSAERQGAAALTVLARYGGTVQTSWPARS